MAGAFDVTPEMLRAVGPQLVRAAETTRSAAGSPGSCPDFGHAGVGSAFAEFTGAWSSVGRALAEASDGFARGVVAAAQTYEVTEQGAAGAMSSISGALSPGRPGPR